MDFKLPRCSKCGKVITGSFTQCFGKIYCLNCMSFVTVYDLVADGNFPLYPDMIETSADVTSNIIETSGVEAMENSDT